MPQDFIAQTGIGEVRGGAAEEDDKKKSKQKARERMQPKMGRIDIDYQVLHDAFFRFQTKPKLTILGDLCVLSFFYSREEMLLFFADIISVQVLRRQGIRSQAQGKSTWQFVG